MTVQISRYGFEDLEVGQEAGFEAMVSDADVDRFADLSGDVSPLHMSGGFATARGFPGRVVHGAYLTALVSQLVGVHLPGENGLLQAVSMQFRRPVPVGTTLTVSGVVDQLSDAVRSAVVKVAIRDRATGDLMATAKATVGFTEAAAGASPADA